jgi:glycine cleavage system H protein
MTKYTESHEWIRVEGTTGIVGITDFAQKELGDIVYVELPQVGKSVKQGQEAVVLESTKAAADVYAPVSGKITAVNEALKTAPELVNQSADSEGWLFKIELATPDELTGLLDQSAYQQLVKR